MYTVETWTGGSWQVFREKLSRQDAIDLFNQLLSVDEFGVRLTCEPVYHG